MSIPFRVGQAVQIVRNTTNRPIIEDYLGQVRVILLFDNPIFDNIPIRLQDDYIDYLWVSIDDCIPHDPTDEEMQRYALWKMKN